jgi:Carboxypeptidase regulatory-like domain
MRRERAAWRGFVCAAMLSAAGLVWVGSAAAQDAAGSADSNVAVNGAQLPQAPEAKGTGALRGTVVDKTGVAVTGAAVRFVRGDVGPISGQDIVASTGENGEFWFGDVAAGTVRLTVSAEGFAPQTVIYVVRAGETFEAPRIVLEIATAVTEVTVTPPTFEIAEEQLKEQEKQRALGFIPNFYVTYIPNAAPLAPKQKFELAWKSLVDPVTFGITGGIAGIEQWQNDFSGYGQGASGFGKRYGAVYADTAIGTMIGSAILPSLLKQDPRYFYKGTGSKKSRLAYALANAVICKGDNGKWQPNYSGIIGGLAAGGISNLYYPASDRNGAGLTFENALIGIAGTAAANVLQEFVIKKFTSNVPGPVGGAGKAVGAMERVLGLTREGGEI